MNIDQYCKRTFSCRKLKKSRNMQIVLAHRICFQFSPRGRRNKYNRLLSLTDLVTRNRRLSENRLVDFVVDSVVDFQRFFREKILGKVNEKLKMLKFRIFRNFKISNFSLTFPKIPPRKFCDPPKNRKYFSSNSKTFFLR